MSIFKRCLFAFACLLLAQVSFAQQLPSSRLYGEVLVNHRPMAGIPVTIRRISDAAGNIDTSRTSTLFRTVAHSDSTGYYYANVEYDTLNRPVLYLVTVQDCDSSIVTQGVTVTGQGGYAPRLEICNQTTLPTQGSLAGSVFQAGSPWSNTEVRIARITRDNGTIDTSGSLFSMTVSTNSVGYYQAYVPVSPTGALTMYRVRTYDCDQSVKEQTVIISGQGVYVPAFFLCDSLNCNTAADFSASTVGLFALVTGNPNPGITHHWDFGDGHVDSNQVSGHQYAVMGQYTICHTVITASCVRVSCQTVWVGDTSQNRYVNAGGRVTAGGHCVSDSVMVEFFGLDQNNNSYSLSADSNCLYGVNIPRGRYLIRATPTAASLVAAGYLPTYYGNVTVWDSLNVAGIFQNRFDLDIVLQKADTIVNRTGGRIRVTMNGDGTQFRSPMVSAGYHSFYVPTARVMLYTRSGKSVAWTAAGTYNYADFLYLPAGTYRIHPDVPYMGSTSEWVTLSRGSSARANLTYEATSQGLSVSNVTAVAAKLGAAALEVAPNPAQTTLSLRLPGVAGAGTVRLLAPDGRAVWTGETSNLSETLSVPVYQLAPGIYHALVSQDGRTLAAARVQVVR